MSKTLTPSSIDGYHITPLVNIMKVGVERGAAWQAALQAASEVGCQQVLLSDRPIRVTERRFADALLLSAGEC